MNTPTIVMYFDYNTSTQQIIDCHSNIFSHDECINLLNTIIDISFNDHLQTILDAPQITNHFQTEIGEMIYKTTIFVLDQQQIKGIVEDITDVSHYIKRAKQMIYAKDMFLDINQAIVEMEQSSNMFDYILEKVTRFFNLTNYSSILKLHDDGYFRFMSAMGYDEESQKDFKFKYEDSIEFKLTEGNFVEPVIIKVLHEDEPAKEKFEEGAHNFIETEDDQKILETLIAPIYYEDALFGIICIDSSQRNTFNESHILIMQYISDQLSMVVERQFLFDEIKHLSIHDVFTGLLNRVQQELIMEKLIKEQCDFTYVNIDLNGMKSINDTYGHHYGDLVILDFAKKARVITEGHAIRTGGDEFAIIFKNRTAKEAELIIKELLSMVSEFEVIVNEHILKYDFSYGIVSYPHEAKTYEDILKISDLRMYLHKKK